MSRIIKIILQPETVQIPDADLLRAVARGDEESLAAIYDRYRTILFGLLFRILGNRAEAEDVLQEVFVQVWQRARDFDENRGKAFTWLVTLARSRAIDRLRSLGSRSRTIEAATKESADAVGDAIEDAINNERGEVVRAALKELPEEQRAALLMAYFDGFSQSEIAERTNTPLGTVKTRMRTGMTKLREVLAPRVRDWL
ncbi:MAG TPA: sigma-70 family RNA polymerase sigma factor [Pyrinomonadaceae bacterium]|nr:sigma-70 family RNA polymerase sigma factor [Pyrinomonadaceae bacterium]